MATNTVALESPSEEVAFATHGGVGVITLNRPKALNALTLEMIRAMRPVLEGWASDPAIAVVVIEGEGEKAFCAGGDVRAVWKAGKEFEPAGGFDPRLCAD
ncbi:MAG: enoyl-CoA hydratase/isomerase family protein, partial [Pseudomonadota bacterium]